MKRFIAIYHAPAEAMAQMTTATPEEKQKGMDAWMSWKEKSGDTVVDFGAPLMGGKALSQGNSWADSTKDVSGYSILQGESLEAVQTQLTDHPHLHWHPQASIELHEVIPM